MNRNGILLIFAMVLSLCLCGAVAAHPGHGTPIEEPSDPGTGDTGTTDTGSSGSTSSGSSQGSSSSGSSSTSSSSKYSGTTSGATQSDQSGTTDTQTGTTDNTATQTGTTPEETVDNTGSSNSAAGPVAMIGLMVVVGLIAMSFPYKEGGTLSNLQMSLLGR